MALTRGGTSELWRPIDGWAGYYEVSTAGRVRSVARVVITAGGYRRNVPGRLLKLCDSRGPRRGGGGPRCSLSRPGEKVTYYPRAATVATRKRKKEK